MLLVMKMGKQQQLLVMVATATHLMLLVVQAALACTHGMSVFGLQIPTMIAFLKSVARVNVMSQLTMAQWIEK
jgi:hypothetical protein